MNPLEATTDKCVNLYTDSTVHDYDITNNNSFTYDYKWEGIVIDLKENELIARLIESSTNEEDELVFPIKNVPEDDLELLEIGAIFNFYVGYKKINGTVQNSDFIKFRRKKIDNTDIDDILDTMNEIDFGSVLEEH